MSDGRDSAQDTWDHITHVQNNIDRFLTDLHRRGVNHDQSKLQDPEKEAFDRVTPELQGSTYQSEEYKRNLADIGAALEHHYEHNRHHPEHYGYIECNGCFKRFQRFSGYGDYPVYGNFCDVCGYTQYTRRPDISGMDLSDLVEMLCDWKAATLRHSDGDIMKSLELNIQRYEIDEQLATVLKNTIVRMLGEDDERMETAAES